MSPGVVGAIGPAHPEYVPTGTLNDADADRCATCGRHYQDGATSE